MAVSLFSYVTSNETRGNGLTSTRGGLDCIWGKITSLKGWSSIGTECPRKWLSHNPWRYLEDMWMWHLGTSFSSGLGSAGVMFPPDDLKSLFQTKWFYRVIITDWFGSEGIFKDHLVPAMHRDKFHVAQNPFQLDEWAQRMRETHPIYANFI